MDEINIVKEVMARLAIILVMVCLTGCPEPEPEILEVSHNTLEFPFTGEEKTFTVESNLNWTVVSNETIWLTASPASGKNKGTVAVTALENTSISQRSATITVTGGEIIRTISVKQTGATPTLAVSLDSLSFSSSVEEKTFTVESNSSWTVNSNVTWLTVSPASGSDKGVVTVKTTANPTTSQRTATLTISGVETTKTIVVTQSGAAPALTVSQNAITLRPAVLESTFTITSNISWTVNKGTASWLTVSPSSGSNNGTVKVTASEYISTSSRKATLTVSGGGITRSIDVTQEGAYLNVSPTSLTFSPSNAQSELSISGNIGWTIEVSSDAKSWLTVAPVSGSSSTGTVRVNVTANTSSLERTGTLTFRGGTITQSIKVTQLANAYLNISPMLMNFSSSGEQKTFTIESNVNWTVSKGSATWLTVSPASGSNNGAVTVTASANTLTSDRTATITVEGGGITRTINVTQNKFNPSLSVSRSLLFFEINGGSLTFNVTSNTNWTVNRGSASWLTVSPASGSNNGTVTVSATANTSISRREAVLTVSGGGISRTIDVTQERPYGYVSFWVGRDFFCGNINVTLSGRGTKTITGYYLGIGGPSCTAQYNAIFTDIPYGTYTYTASCSGRSWSGSVTLNFSCVLVELK